MRSPLLHVAGLSKRFGGQAALTDVSLDVEQGEFVALLGPSGCGKTTLLRCIAGFHLAESGAIRIAGEDVTQLPPYRRPLNTVFQNYALFPHMTVAENVAYGPRRQGASRAEAAMRAGEALDLVGLSGFADRLPRHLSGGQQQRVALARAIVNKPKLLLLDEPLSALDYKLRKRVQTELKQLQAKLGIAFVFVTHDQEEAMTMADRIVVMNAGRVEQVGLGQEIYRRPATRFVADFIGEANFLPCATGIDGRPTLTLGGQILPLPAPLADRTQGNAPVAVLRPEQVRLLEGVDAPAGHLAATAIVTDIVHVGSHAMVTLACGETQLVSRLGGTLPAGLARGASVRIGIDPADLHLIAA
ncbi:ABC transporter ATP-binding protein [Aquabacter sp. P-9]|uniref:ABC transporter ATP-binding protein n=1 Tax=Aquabacter sediminis TaxID=3029197 RepID=UPI00237EE985|nr:ABC transporter ATP-binding protein [Aquabacter sp. P-9]MDE1568489.1 ABC transporter ATP-binding protein [Aquabacter sp. P-9]